MKISKADRKAWAREQLVGVCNITFPSFSPDMSELDEDGIRWDVEQAVRHGFSATLAACETGVTFEEAKRYVKTVVDASKGRLLVSVTLLFDSLEKNRAMLKFAEQAGVDLVQIGFPPNYYPHSEAEVEAELRAQIESTNLGVVLYPSPHYNLERFHNSGFPLGVLERLAPLPNVIAVEAGEAGLAADLISRVGDQILVSNPVERFLPLMVQATKQQFIGPGCYEALQSPEQPHFVNYFKLLREGRTAEAMEIFWRLAPARGLFEARFMPTAMLGCYHWPLQKYYQWLVGGNGGYTRQPCMKLHQFELEPIKFTLMQMGIMPRQPDEEFYYGRCNFKKMGRAVEQPAFPLGPPGGPPMGGPPGTPARRG
jgi:4-hydroxy-tetrahydrodipicolinate synthase